MDFTTLSGEALASALALDVSTASPEMLVASLVPRREAATALFAIESPTAEQADAAEAIVASIGSIEAEQKARADKAQATADKFAAAKATFAEQAEKAKEEEKEEEKKVEAAVETVDETADSEADAEDEQDGEDADESDDNEAEADADADTDGEDAGEAEATVTASAKGTSAAKKVGARAKRPAVKASNPVTITASSDIEGFSTGQSLNGMEEVTKALLSRANGFAPFNEASARGVRDMTGKTEAISRVGLASFGKVYAEGATSNKSGDDYNAYQNAVKDHRDAMVASMNAAVEGKDMTLTAAGWCAPSETIYSWIADFVVDGLLTGPEVNAPRGGINITTGPAHVTQGTPVDDFGFVQTEAQAEAQTVKTCETIECPEFTDHRLDAIGYCYKIPLLTQAAYPELITDALRLANVMYAHKMNARKIKARVDLSDTVAFSGYGASFTDSLEALTILATRERRKWNVGVNAIMEVKVPQWAQEVYRADMSRRTGLALTDVATDQKIAAEFAARRLAVEYVSDWQELPATGALVLPGSFKVMVYPSGTFVDAGKDVINMSAVYDAASLSINEYTGVFFEQGHKTVKVGYGSSILTIPVNTAGETGAAIMTGLGDSTAGGSF